jgi:peptidylglycine monooxygenase
MKTLLQKLILICFAFHLSTSSQVMKIAGNGQRGEQEIRMPNSKPNLPETYLCTPLKLDLNESVYITGFEPKADKNTAHHMILFGCQMPGKTDPVFHCGAMDAGQQEDSPTTSPCANGTSIIYAWAQNAPKLHLPKDVGFRVGGEGSNVVWLVLQVKHLSETFTVLMLSL